MRLNRLDLTRYGKFTDRVLDFGIPTPGKPDFHLIFGPNEAGKSTTMAAFLDLLFGIEAQSRYGFLHPYPTMKIGATLELATGPVELIRLKRKDGLRDALEQPVPELVLQTDLGGIDRAAYQTMFSLDDETLERGGDSILASKGDLGTLLFAASAGLADFGAALDRLKLEADKFHKPRSRSSDLYALKAELSELKTRRDGLDTFAVDYARILAERERTGQAYAAANGERAKLRARHDEIQRLLAALPRLAVLRGLRSRLAPLEALPEAPAGWHGDIGPLRDEALTLQARAEALASERSVALAALQALTPDAAALTLAEPFALLDDLRSRYVTAEKDLPDRRLRLREAEAIVAALLHQLGQSDSVDPQRLVLTAEVTGTLRRLIEMHSGVIADRRAADREKADAAEHLAELTRRRAQNPGNELDEVTARQLADILMKVREQDFSARSKHAERDLASRNAALNASMAMLRPWSGSAAALAELPVPGGATLEGWRLKQRKLDGRIEQAEADEARLETERQKLQAELDTITALGGVIGDAEADALRAARQAAWVRHVADLAPETAAHFEVALHRDDAATAGRLRHQKELARLYELSIRISTLAVEIRRAREAREAAFNGQNALRCEISAMLAAIGLPEATTLPDLEGWLARREKALDGLLQVREAERNFAETQADLEVARSMLVKGLAAAAVPFAVDSGMVDLVRHAQDALDRQAAFKAERAAQDEARQRLALRERQRAGAIDAETLWRQAWAEACATTWLGEGQEPAGVRDRLAVLAELGPALETRDSLAERIAKMEEDQQAFSAEIVRFSVALAPEAGDDPVRSPLEKAGIVARRIEIARTDEARRGQVRDTLAQIDGRQRELDGARLLHEHKKAGMLAHFGAETLGSVEQALQDLRLRAELVSQIAASTREILDAMRSGEIAAAEAALDAFDRSQLEAEQAELAARLTDLDQRAAELFSEHSKAEDRLAAVGGDEAVARLEAERRTVLAVIEERASQYLRLRLGILAAEQALRLYRDRHRSSMMTKASEAFAAISRGAYRGLAAQSEKDAEFLIAITRDGASKRAEDLSKGTRFQLYLALRAAGYQEFAALRPPVPFLADDILETFDDERAEATFALFGGMALSGQVIYLTHHAHLCEIARRVIPEARIHDLRA